jgi:CHASE3 domain sensor protein
MEAQQREILQLINLAYGAQGLEEFRSIRKQVAKERQDAVYRQIEMRQQIAQGFLLVVLLGGLIALIALILS